MPELKNIRHELFCQTYINSPLRRVRYNATRAYMSVYPASSYKSALSNGPALAKKVRRRIDELFNRGI